jgi:hypothetical protein
MSKIRVIAPYSIDHPVDWQRIWECNLRDGFTSVVWGRLVIEQNFEACGSPRPIWDLWNIVGKR